MKCGSRRIFPNHAPFLGVIHVGDHPPVSPSCATPVQQTEHWMGSSIRRVGPTKPGLAPTAATDVSTPEASPARSTQNDGESLGGRNSHRSIGGPTCWRKAVRGLRRGLDRVRGIDGPRVHSHQHGGMASSSRPKMESNGPRCFEGSDRFGTSLRSKTR